MTKTTASPELNKIDQLASEYEARGYTVIRAESSLPDFLTDYHPDLVAMSPSDNVVVEVKVRRAPTVDPKINRIASIVREHPSWRFEFVAIDAPESEPISLAEAYHTFEQASEFNEQRKSEAALITGWAAAEAALRNLLTLDDYDEAIESSTSPVQIVKTAFSMGLIGRETSDVMLAALEVRNSIAHGLRYTGPGSVGTVATSLLRALEDVFAAVNASDAHRRSPRSADEMVSWFRENYEDPAHSVPYESAEGGHIYYLGGPYDPWEVLLEHFPDAEPLEIEEAARRILPEGPEWVRRGQY